METSGKGLKPRCLEQTGSSSPSPSSSLPPSQQLSFTSSTKHTMSSHQTNNASASTSTSHLNNDPPTTFPPNDKPLMEPVWAVWLADIHGRISWEDIIENIDEDCIRVVQNNDVCENRNCDGLERCLHAEYIVKGTTPDRRQRSFHVCKNCSKKKYVNHYLIFERSSYAFQSP